MPNENICQKNANKYAQKNRQNRHLKSEKWSNHPAECRPLKRKSRGFLAELHEKYINNAYNVYIYYFHLYQPYPLS